MLCLWVGTLNAGEIKAPSIDRAMTAKKLFSSFEPPEVLSSSDVTKYREIFRLQKDGRWKKANTLIAKLSDKILLGHVFAQRYLHPTKYRSGYKELKNWMAKYADHPHARRLYKLALKRKPKNWRNPQPPEIIELSGSDATSKIKRIKGRPLSRANRSKVRSLKRQIQLALRRGHTLTAKQILQSQNVKRLFSNTEYDQASAKLGQVYFNDGRDKFALQWAGQAATRSGHIIPSAHWTSGLAAWRMKRMIQSANHFEEAARHSETSAWLHTASAFWAARANLVSRQPEKVNALLKIAANKPRTFYGLLALQVLGLPMPFNWAPQRIGHAAIDSLINYPRGRRGLALLQLDETTRAGRELRNLSSKLNKNSARTLLVLAENAGMAELAVRLDARLFPDGGGSDKAAYPVPRWEPVEGFKIDRALIYALIRQESRFNPMAKSWAGARGLMQLMPATGRFVAKTARLKYDSHRELFEPALNMMLGQRYIKILSEDQNIKSDLFLMMAAWNGGPGNLSKWRRKVNDLGDPLFFIESLPSRETRNFIEHTLANLWIYRDRFGQSQPSLTNIAAGQWPMYVPLDRKDEKQVATNNGKRSKN